MGFLLSIPALVTGWQRHSGLAQAARDEPLTMCGPVLYLLATLAGIAWMKATKRREPRRSPGQLTEDGGAD